MSERAGDKGEKFWKLLRTGETVLEEPFSWYENNINEVLDYGEIRVSAEDLHELEYVHEPEKLVMEIEGSFDGFTEKIEECSEQYSKLILDKNTETQGNTVYTIGLPKEKELVGLRYEEYDTVEETMEHVENYFEEVEDGTLEIQSKEKGMRVKTSEKQFEDFAVREHYHDLEDLIENVVVPELENGRERIAITTGEGLKGEPDYEALYEL